MIFDTQLISHFNTYIFKKKYKTKRIFAFLNLKKIFFASHGTLPQGEHQCSLKTNNLTTVFDTNQNSYFNTFNFFKNKTKLIFAIPLFSIFNFEKRKFQFFQFLNHFSLSYISYYLKCQHVKIWDSLKTKIYHLRQNIFLP